MTEVERLLILAGAAVSDVHELPPSIRALVDAAGEVFVVTPTLPGRLGWLVSDTDRSRHAADERLDTILGQLASIEVEARGGVGDDTPLTAIDDAVRSFKPDHLLIALRGPEYAGWQERGLLDQVEQRVGLPMTIFEISSDGSVVDRLERSS